MAAHRERFRRLRTMQELVDFSFDVHAPGRILQMPERNIGNSATSHGIFMTSRDRRMDYTEMALR